MLDIRWVRDNPDALDRALQARGAGAAAAQLIGLDDDRKAHIAKLQDAQTRRNAASKEIGKAKASGDEAAAQALIDEIAELKSFVQAPFGRGIILFRAKAVNKLLLPRGLCAFFLLVYKSGNDIDIQYGIVLLQWFNQVLNDLDSLDKRTVKIVEELLEIQDLILTSSQSVDNLIGKVEVAQLESKKSVFRQTYPPIWKQFLPREMRVKIPVLFESVVKAYRQGLNDFYSIYRTLIWINFALFFLFLGFAFYLQGYNRNIQQTETDDRIETFLRIFSRPFAVAILLTITLVFFIYPKAPTVIGDIAALLVIVPLVFVALEVLPKGLRGFIYFISAMFLFNGSGIPSTVDFSLCTFIDS